MNDEKPLRDMSLDEIAALKPEQFQHLAHQHNDHLELRENRYQRFLESVGARLPYAGSRPPYEDERSWRAEQQQPKQQPVASRPSMYDRAITARSQKRRIAKAASPRERDDLQI